MMSSCVHYCIEVRLFTSEAGWFVSAYVCLHVLVNAYSVRIMCKLVLGFIYMWSV